MHSGGSIQQVKVDIHVACNLMVCMQDSRVSIPMFGAQVKMVCTQDSRVSIPMFGAQVKIVISLLQGSLYLDP